MSLPSELRPALSVRQPQATEGDGAGVPHGVPHGVPAGDSDFLLREKRLNWQAKKAISFDLEKTEEHISDNFKGIS